MRGDRGRPWHEHVGTKTSPERIDRGHISGTGGSVERHIALPVRRKSSWSSGVWTMSDLSNLIAVNGLKYEYLCAEGSGVGLIPALIKRRAKQKRA